MGVENMRILNNLKIRTRFSLIIVVVLISIITISIQSILVTNRIGVVINTINSHPLVVSNTAADSKIILLNIYKTYQEAFIDKNNKNRLIHEKNVESLENQLRLNLSTINSLILGETGQNLAKKVNAHVEKWIVNNYGTFDKIYDEINREKNRSYFAITEKNEVASLLIELDSIQKYAQTKATTLELEAKNIQNDSFISIVIVGILISFAIFIFSLIIVKNITNSLKDLKDSMSESIDDNKFIKAKIVGKNEIVDVSNFYNILIEKLKLQFESRKGINDLSEIITLSQGIKEIANKTISFLSQYTEAGNGAFYLFNNEKENLDLIASFAFTERQSLLNHVQMGESLVGQVAIEQKPIILTKINRSEGLINTGIISEAPLNIIAFPLLYDQELCGVIELSSFNLFDEAKLSFLKRAADIIAVSINSTLQSAKIHDLLEESQKANALLEAQQVELVFKSDELQTQQEELRQSNEELEEQAKALKESENKLQLQQEELRVTNEELETHTKQLEEQKRVLNEKNSTLIITQAEMIKKAEALEKANKYKSEFLANMSHELRTPLNSILVLSQLLSSKDGEEPLTEKEKEFANTIHSSGEDLLTLINGVLDLSKVEAGKLHIHNEKVYLKELLSENKNMFESMVEIKDLAFEALIDNDMPEYIMSDSLRINQILKNLISNSIKFTHKGKIKLLFRNITPEESLELKIDKDNYVGIEVIDTGIGIAKEKQKEVFEAFKQSDGTTSRQYGGTGLGLTISLELSKLLGGNIYLESEINNGSKFLLLLPKKPMEEVAKSDILSAIEALNRFDNSEFLNGVIEDKKNSEKILESNETKQDEKKILIIEDDPTFSQILFDLAEEKGYTPIKAFSGKEGILLAKNEKLIGIILDIGLPDMDGMILASLLSEDENTKNIPIHIISGNDKISEVDTVVKAPKNIIGFLKKPVDIKSIYKTLSKIENSDIKGEKRILVVGACGDEDFKKISQLGHLQISKVLTEKEALIELENENYGCIILDIKLPDSSGIDFMTKLRENLKIMIPVIIYTEADIEAEEIDGINKYTETIILKSTKSKDRLIDEVSLFLYDVQKKHLEYREYENVVENDKYSLEGISVLLADDDSRNVFAIMHLLESNGMKVVVAKDGFEAIEKFEENKIDVILMDIMMPKLDGFEAIKSIRNNSKGRNVPIIVLTAKAMSEDREKCIKAGASDYLTKPVETDRLLSMIKVWVS